MVDKSTTTSHKPGIRATLIPCLPIIKGTLAGTWWSPASGGKIARVFLGSYEHEQTRLMANSFRQNSVFFDVGAHHGYYSLIASRVSGGGARIVAFEPDQENIAFLRKHVRANGLDQVEIVESAVGAEAGTVGFSKGTGTGTGHIAENGDVQVPLVTLDDEVRRRNLCPTHIKIDVEGAEVDVLTGAQDTLQKHRPVLFLSTHGDRAHADCCRMLASMDYRLEPILGDSVETTTEIFCVPAEQQLEIAA